MSEIIQSIDSEFRSETHGRITVIFDRHADDDELKAGLPMWRPKVYEAVAKHKPFALAVDSISSGSTPKVIGQMIPVRDLSRFEKGLHVIGADVTSLWPDSDNPKVNQVDWDAIIKATIKYDPDFSPDADWAGLTDEVHRQFAIEESVISAGEAVLVARILWRIIKNRQAKNVPPQAAYKPRTFTRREFLKMGGVTVAAAAFAGLNYGREPAFFAGMKETLVTDETPNLLQAVVRATKPILLGTDNWGNMRDAKLGVAVMNKLIRPSWSEKSAVIIFGNGHILDEYPGQYDNETLEQAINRLLSVSRRGFEAIIKNNQNEPNRVPPEVMKAALIEIFATSDEYLPITPLPDQKQSEITWLRWQSVLIPEVVEVINEVCGL